MRITVGDITGDGNLKDIMFVSTAKELVICQVKSNAAKTSLTYREKLDDGKHNYPYHEKDLVGANFFDLDDIGTHSILLEKENGTLRGYIYLNDGSSYFIKALGYDGAYNSKHDPAQTKVGVSYQYLMTNLEGTELLRVGYQNIANAYRNLHFPYMLDGVGRCQNYLEYFSFGHYDFSGKTNQYTPVIPNSQLIISKKGNSVDIELLINPSAYLTEIFIMFWLIFICLSVVTIILHVRELKQDKKEKRQGFIITA